MVAGRRRIAAGGRDRLHGLGDARGRVGGHRGPGLADEQDPGAVVQAAPTDLAWTFVPSFTRLCRGGTGRAAASSSASNRLGISGPASELSAADPIRFCCSQAAQNGLKRAPARPGTMHATSAAATSTTPRPYHNRRPRPPYRPTVQTAETRDQAQTTVITVALDIGIPLHDRTLPSRHAYRSDGTTGPCRAFCSLVRKGPGVSPAARAFPERPAWREWRRLGDQCPLLTAISPHQR